ncbi:MAG TPA: MOP flippase family protein [Candidatus Limnocylindrales bacterium]|nr:MOP flippase family protein [Candidatus Limnocylindrales bacterium]
MGLKTKTINAFLWVSSAKIVNQLVSWLVTVLLARLLLPSDFGLIGMAWIFIGFLDLMNELGVGAAIIQKKNLDEDDLNSTFWISVLSGLFFYLTAFLLAPGVAIFFNNDKLTSVLRVLSLVFIIGALKTIPFNLLTKELAFAKRSIAEFLSVLIGGIFSATLALLGGGVWSIVYGTLLQNLILSALAFYFAPWKPKPVFLLEKVKQLLSFGVSIAGSRVLWYFYTSSDSLIIGKFLGDKLLGFYAMAFQLSTMPVQKITAVVNQVTFSVFSKLQDDKENLRVYFLKITRFISLITFPCSVGLFLVSESLIKVILTEKWLPILTPFRILCLMGLLKSVDAIIPSLLMAKGKPQILFKYTFLCFIFLPLSFLIGARYSIAGVAFVWISVYPLLSIYLFKQGLTELDLSVAHYMQSLFPAIFTSAGMVLVVLIFQLADKTLYNRSAHFTLIGSCILGVTSYLTFLLWFHKSIIEEVRDIYDSLRWTGSQPKL